MNKTYLPPPKGVGIPNTVLFMLVGVALGAAILPIIVFAAWVVDALYHGPLP